MIKIVVIITMPPEKSKNGRTRFRRLKRAEMLAPLPFFVYNKYSFLRKKTTQTESRC